MKWPWLHDEQAIEEQNDACNAKTKMRWRLSCWSQNSWFYQVCGKGWFWQRDKEIKSVNALPAICGRVCPRKHSVKRHVYWARKERQYQLAGLSVLFRIMNEKKEWLYPKTPSLRKESGDRRFGTRGLTAAADLARMVIQSRSLKHYMRLVAFLHMVFRNSVYQEIVNEEVEYVKKLGVTILLDSVVGKIETLDELLSEFECDFPGTGAGFLCSWISMART